MKSEALSVDSNLFFAYFLALGVYFLDQLTKVLAEIYLVVPGRSFIVIEHLELFRFTFVKNTGAAWGILQGHRALFILVAVIVSVGCIWIMHNFKKHIMIYPVACVLGGGFGNMTDRFFLRSGVVDFFDIGIYSYRWPTFNVADIALTVGVVWIAYLILTGNCPLEDYFISDKQ